MWLLFHSIGKLSLLGLTVKSEVLRGLLFSFVRVLFFTFLNKWRESSCVLMHSLRMHWQVGSCAWTCGPRCNCCFSFRSSLPGGNAMVSDQHFLHFPGSAVAVSISSCQAWSQLFAFEIFLFYVCFCWVYHQGSLRRWLLLPGFYSLSFSRGEIAYLASTTVWIHLDFWW